MTAAANFSMIRPFAAVSLVLALAGCAADVPDATADPATSAAESREAAQAAAAEAEPAAAPPETNPTAAGETEMWTVAAQISGAMHAMAEACGDYSAGELAQMNADQKRTAIDMGGDPERFDAVFASAYDAAEKKIATASREKLAEECESLAQMKAEAERMKQ